VPTDNKDMGLGGAGSRRNEEKELNNEQASNRDKGKEYGLGEDETDWYLYWAENEPVPTVDPADAVPNSPTGDQLESADEPS
jgi:hypothetical protein